MLKNRYSIVLMLSVSLFIFLCGDVKANGYEFKSSMKLTIVYSAGTQEGYLAFLSEDCLVLHTQEGPQSFPTVLIDSVSFDGQQLLDEHLEKWLSDLSFNQERKIESHQEVKVAVKQAKGLAVVSPALGTMRMASSNSRISRTDWISLAAYDSVLLGGTMYGVFGAENWGVVLPFAATMVLFRIWAVKDIQIGYTTDYQDHIKLDDSCGLR